MLTTVRGGKDKVEPLTKERVMYTTPLLSLVVGLQSAAGPEAGAAVLGRAVRPGRGVALRAQEVPRGGGERAVEVPERSSVHFQARYHREVSQLSTASEPPREPYQY